MKEENKGRGLRGIKNWSNSKTI